jgi:hypothetical protein
MIERTEQRFELKPEYLAADTAYGSAATLNWIVSEKNIAPHIPVMDKSKREDGTFSREDFKFDKDRAAGKLLTTTGKIVNDEQLLYRAIKRDCAICPFKMQCCPNTAPTLGNDGSTIRMQCNACPTIGPIACLDLCLGRKRKARASSRRPQ